ncbi:hypothetical protein BDQ17DRAFT_1423326 [Cyathus striatus]|nr:hypothetical protein BDQ17DRAFT_1423326 [Cyathus striatus]
MAPESPKPDVPLAKYIREVQAEKCKPSLPDTPFYKPFAPPYPLSARATGPSLNSAPLSTPRPHVPRPPNAFMLFRSDFLKRGVIPPDVECRQQNLSRIAGEVWNLCRQKRRRSGTIKQRSPSGLSQRKGKGRVAPECSEEDRIREIREKYTKVPGPAAPPSRRRKPNYKKLASRNISPLPVLVSHPSHQFLRLHRQSLRATARIDVPRRPSTSLGFATGHSFKDAPGPMPQFPHVFHGFDTAPVTYNGNSISMPSTPNIDPVSRLFYAPPHSNPTNSITDILPVNAESFRQHLGPVSCSAFTNSPVEDPLNTAEPFIGTLYPGEDFAFPPPTFNEDFLFGPDYSLQSTVELGAWNFPPSMFSHTPQLPSF